jgi:hypothetical protein
MGRILTSKTICPHESGVALRFPPQSMNPFDLLHCRADFYGYRLI